MRHVAGTRDKEEGMSVTQDKVRLVAFGQRQRGGNILRCCPVILQGRADLLLWGRDNEEGISYDVALLYCRTRQACCGGAETTRREYIFMMLPCYIAGQSRLVALGQRQ